MDCRIIEAGHWFVNRTSIWDVEVFDLIEASDVGSEDGTGMEEEERKEARLWVLKEGDVKSSGEVPSENTEGSYDPPKEAIVSF